MNSLQNEIDMLQKEVQNHILQQKAIQAQLDQTAGRVIYLDYKLSSAKHQLKQKEQGYKLINQLHGTIGSVEDKKDIITKSLELINVGLNITHSVFVSKEEVFTPLYFLGFFQEQIEHAKKQNLNLLSILNEKPLIVNKSVELTDFIVKAQQIFGIPYYIFVPVFSKFELRGWLVVGRQQEVKPFCPPFDQGDLETLETIAGFISIRLDNISLLHNLKKAHDSLEEMNKSLEEKVAERTLQLNQSNQELQNTLTELKKTQAQVIHAEKMAGLGQLVAGISHEINTPAGAILNSIGEIKNDYGTLLEEFINLVPHLGEALQEEYRQICKFVLEQKTEVSTFEARQISKELEKYFEENGVANARSISKSLSLIGFNQENAGILINLLKTAGNYLIHEHIFKLGMTQIHVKDIDIAISRIVNLVKALKLYSHAGQEELVLSSLKEDIDNTLIILHNRIKRGITVNKQYSDIPPIECYADQLNQVWTNLINNAIEAMKGEGQLYIKTKEAEEDGWVIVEIEDNGPGIPPDILTKIFEPYFTTKPKGEGTGLGLAISKEIINKHQGTITVVSKPGSTRFSVGIPTKVKGKH